jgi:Tfp pilus assembly protein PilN
LGPVDAAPGALLALAASLDAASSDRLDLLPGFLKPSAASEPALRRMVAGACALAIAVAGWGAWSGLSRLAALSREGGDLQTLAALQARLEAVEPVLIERQAHAARLEVLGELAEGRRLPPRLLQAIALATPPAVQLDTIVVERVESGWQARVSGTGAGVHAASAMGSVDQMFRELAARVPDASAVLTHLSDAGGERPGEALVRFAIALTLLDGGSHPPGGAESPGTGARR